MKNWIKYLVLVFAADVTIPADGPGKGRRQHQRISTGGSLPEKLSEASKGKDVSCHSPTGSKVLTSAHISHRKYRYHQSVFFAESGGMKLTVPFLGFWLQGEKKPISQSFGALSRQCK